MRPSTVSIRCSHPAQWIPDTATVISAIAASSRMAMSRP